MHHQEVIKFLRSVFHVFQADDLAFVVHAPDKHASLLVEHAADCFLSGIDRRFKAFVLMAGGLSDEVDMKTKGYEEYRQKMGPERFDAFVAKYTGLDPGKFVAHAAPAVVFMQYATEEKYLTPDGARQYAAIVSEPKRFKLYDAPHALNAEARRDRLEFLSKQLKVKPLTPAQTARIPDLYQPPEPN